MREFELALKRIILLYMFYLYVSNFYIPPVLAKVSLIDIDIFRQGFLETIMQSVICWLHI